MPWINYFVTSLSAKGTEGHCDAAQLRSLIQKHNGSEAYHCAFDLLSENLVGGSVAEYRGIHRGAMGRVWFDFDSHDGGQLALDDARRFVAFLNVPDLDIYFSGSKGFHIGVPQGYFGIEACEDFGKRIHAIAKKLKEQFPTLDTAVFNPNRKFRAPGSKHPKTGKYKVKLNSLEGTMDSIKIVASSRPKVDISDCELRSLLNVLTDLVDSPAKNKEKVNPPKIDYTAPTGVGAFSKCGFLQFCRDEQEKVTEPQWYAALSIVARFQEGRKQCHQVSYKHPGYSVQDCNAKIDQALSESSPRTCENVSGLWDGCSRCPLYTKINSPVNIRETSFYATGKNGALIPQYRDLLTCFQSDSPYKTIADMKAVYQFRKTHYEEITPIEIKHYAETHFVPDPQEKVRQEFYNKIIANEVTKRAFFIETTANKINFGNGVLEIDSSSRTASPIKNMGTLRGHSPQFGFRGVLPYNFNPTATAPTFTWWIEDVMLGDTELIKILQEFMGYVIRGGEYKYHKALWLSGSGRNGKSTFLSVLKALIGTGNYSTLSIRQIINDKFSSADLDGKIANFSEETSPEELSDSGPFKNLTGDGELLAQKKYGDPYSFRNRAKLIMTYNEVPELRDLSPGMMSRPIIVPFEKDMTADELQDKNMKEKLLAELSGIFNWALEGWNRLETQGQFTTSEKSNLAKEKVREASCSALQWVNDYVTFLPIDSNSSNHIIIQPTELFESYKAIEGRYAYKSVKFFRRIMGHEEIKKRRRHTRNGNEYFSLMIRTRQSALKSVNDPKTIVHNDSRSFTPEY